LEAEPEPSTPGEVSSADLDPDSRS